MSVHCENVNEEQKDFVWLKVLPKWLMYPKSWILTLETLVLLSGPSPSVGSEQDILFTLGLWDFVIDVCEI